MTLPHLLREPDGEPQGALVLNHGRGTDERDLFGLLAELDPEARLLGVTPGAPLGSDDVAAISSLPVGPGGRHWYAVERVGHPHAETFTAAYTALTNFLDGLLEGSGIGWDRTVIGGFSMGAVMAYAVALGIGRPSPAGIIGLSGFIPTVEGWSAELDGRAGLPILIHHGLADATIPVGFGRRAAQVLTQGGVDVDYIETDAGHWVPPEILPRLRGHVEAALARAGGPDS